MRHSFNRRSFLKTSLTGTALAAVPLVAAESKSPLRGSPSVVKPLAMKFAYDMLGPDRLLFSSDHPWGEPKLILNGLRSLKLPATDEAKILAGNARQLFQIA